MSTSTSRLPTAPLRTIVTGIALVLVFGLATIAGLFVTINLFASGNGLVNVAFLFVITGVANALTYVGVRRVSQR